MKKFSTCSLLLILFCYGLFAQSIATEVISPAGSSVMSETIHLDWTLGEGFIQTNVMEDGMITEGFHQPDIRIEEIKGVDFQTFIFEVYPNPTTDVIHVSFGLDVKVGELLLLDEQGKTLQIYRPDANEHRLQIKLLQFPSGIYYLAERNSEGNTGRSYRIIKI